MNFCTDLFNFYIEYNILLLSVIFLYVLYFSILGDGRFYNFMLSFTLLFIIFTTCFMVGIRFMLNILDSEYIMFVLIYNLLCSVILNTLIKSDKEFYVLSLHAVISIILILVMFVHDFFHYYLLSDILLIFESDVINWSFFYYVLAIIICIIFLFTFIIIQLRNNKIEFESITILYFIYTFSRLFLQTNDILVMFPRLESLGLGTYIFSRRVGGGISSYEGGIKYFSIGSIASGLILYGIASYYMIFGSIDYSNLIILSMYTLSNSRSVWIIIIALYLIMLGIFFKLGVYPFHNWVADIYKSASYNMLLILGTVSKLIIILFMMHCIILYKNFIESYMNLLIGYTLIICLLFFGVVSIVIGCKYSIHEHQIKRFMAYSSVVNMGSISLGSYASSSDINSLVVVIAYAIVYFVGVYGLFLVLSLYDISTAYGQNSFDQKFESILGYLRFLAGNRFMAACLWINLLSLMGIPPFAGFYVKYALLEILYFNGNILLVLFLLIANVVMCIPYPS